MKKYFLLIAVLLIILLIVLVLMSVGNDGISTDKNNFTDNKSKMLDITSKFPGSLFKILAPSEKIIIDPVNNQVQYMQAEYFFKDEFSYIYERIGLENDPQNSLVVYPTFTASAYSENGFYSFYSGNCDTSCLTVPIEHDLICEFHCGRIGFQVLKKLGYNTMTDIDIDANPEKLLEYQKIILLHNEYVTKTMFDAITSHPNVIYLYPNALYAEVSINYDDDTITLVRGHGFPDTTVLNGFNWEYDNTHPYEYDTICENWEFYDIPQGKMLNCYPEFIIYKNISLLESIKNF